MEPTNIVVRDCPHQQAVVTYNDASGDGLRRWFLVDPAVHLSGERLLYIGNAYCIPSTNY